MGFRLSLEPESDGNMSIESHSLSVSIPVQERSAILPGYVAFPGTKGEPRQFLELLCREHPDSPRFSRPTKVSLLQPPIEQYEAFPSSHSNALIRLARLPRNRHTDFPQGSKAKSVSTIVCTPSIPFYPSALPHTMHTARSFAKFGILLSALKSRSQSLPPLRSNPSAQPLPWSDPQSSLVASYFRLIQTTGARNVPSFAPLVGVVPISVFPCTIRTNMPVELALCDPVFRAPCGHALPITRCCCTTWRA